MNSARARLRVTMTDLYNDFRIITREGVTSLRGKTSVMALGTFDGVLDVDHSDVAVGSALEGDAAGVSSVVVAGTVEVDEVLEAVEFVFQRNPHGFRDDFGTGTGVDGFDVDLRRSDLRILRDRKFVDTDGSGKHHHQTDDDGELRTLDEYL